MYKIGDIIEVEVSGIENYGIFVKAEDDYTGLIHISEIDNNYIKDINKYVKVGDDIYANVIGVDDATKHLKLSIKNMNYNDNNHGKRTIKERSHIKIHFDMTSLLLYQCFNSLLLIYIFSSDFP